MRTRSSLRSRSGWSLVPLVLLGMAACSDGPTGPQLGEVALRADVTSTSDTANAHPQVYELPPIGGNGCDDDLHPTGPACNPGDDPPPCEVNCSGGGGGDGGGPGYGGGGAPPPGNDAGLGAFTVCVAKVFGLDGFAAGSAAVAALTGYYHASQTVEDAEWEWHYASGDPNVPEAVKRLYFRRYTDAVDRQTLAFDAALAATGYAGGKLAYAVGVCGVALAIPEP